MPYKNRLEKNKWVRKHREQVRQLIREYKLERGCKICGYNKYPGALDFHHRNPKKKLYKISGFGCRKFETILAEIEKCDILCKNCHAEKHQN